MLQGGKLNAIVGCFPMPGLDLWTRCDCLLGLLILVLSSFNRVAASPPARKSFCTKALKESSVFPKAVALS